MSNPTPPVSPGIQMIPEFCRGRPLLMLLIAMELVACVLTLASDVPLNRLLLHGLLISVYMLWMGFSCAVALCVMRRYLQIRSVLAVFLICWALMVGVICVLSELAWLLLTATHIGPTVHGSQSGFLLRNGVMGAIIAFLLLRYFWERNQYQEEIRAESEARYLALQARIHPHFLFNALNSLAELIRARPGKAEDMVVDLAQLFRVSLDSSSRLVTLSEEIETVKGYLRIEEIRLGDKLLVNWRIPKALLSATLPRLVIQPLVENAILHGVSRLRARGVMHISAQLENNDLMIDVENPLPPAEAPEKSGTGVAIANIEQRIKLIYGNRARLQLGETQGEFGALFRARLRLPLKFRSSEQNTSDSERLTP